MQSRGLRRVLSSLAIAALWWLVPTAGAETPRLLQQPTLSQTQIAFVYGDELWVVPRTGGEAARLTNAAGPKSRPKFSPDGDWIAFTWEIGGSKNVHVIKSAGGRPKRVTYYPGHDLVAGWTPDGREILFESTRQSHSPRYYQLFTVPMEGGAATVVPLPMAYQGSFSPDGRRIAYTPIPRGIVFGGGPLLGWDHVRWPHYGGGLKPRILLADVSDSRVDAIPRGTSSDFNPMWVDDAVYFLSDRSGGNALFKYDTRSRSTTRVEQSQANGIESACAGPGGIVYEVPGSIRLLDLTSGTDKPVSIRLSGEFPQVLPRWADASKLVRSAQLSPGGDRIVVEARGEVFVVDADRGVPRNLTRSSGAADRDPVWAPDGRHVAYFSDQTGEFALHIRDVSGQGQLRRVPLADRSSHFFRPLWSPDGTKVLYMQGRNLWYVRIAGGAPVKVTTDRFRTPITEIDQRLSADWSPDSQWIAYNGQLPSALRAVFAYSLTTDQSHQITDGGADAGSVSFDPSGDYLYFTASTNLAAKLGWLEMSSLRAVSTAHVYALVLRGNTPSPLAESSKDRVRSSTAANAARTDFAIDLNGIRDRAVALPIPARNYLRVAAVGPTRLLLLTAPDAGASDRTLYSFDLATRQTRSLATSVTAFSAARDRRRVLIESAGQWQLLDLKSATARPVASLSSLKTWIEPREEWRQIYHEAWHTQRDAFYVENLHGVDVEAAKRRYLPLLDSVVSRSDLNYLLTLMLGEFSVGHLFIGSGDIPGASGANAGLLGADIEMDSGRHRFRRVFSGGYWNPDVHAPLAQPGATVTAGEYLLEVNGRRLAGTEDIHQVLLGKANVPIRIRVGSQPNGANSRELIVTPTGNDLGLRSQAWIAENVRRVAERTNGRIGYVYLEDTGTAGMRSFDRYFHAQANLEGLIVDARFNSGGTMADYILAKLDQEDIARFYARDAMPMPVPRSAVHGPKVLMVNEYSASGGDYLPWAFRRMEGGTIVGRRTWGGLVGIVDTRRFIDGGFVTVPEDGFYTLDGRWEVENAGVSPDIDVTLDPYFWRRGRDLQLEAAIEHALDRLSGSPRKPPPVPAFPRYPPPF